MSLEDDLKELRRKYAIAIRKENYDEAHRYIRKARKLKGESVSESDGGSVDSDSGSVSGFEELDGVGSEIAAILEDEFGSVDALRGASVEDLEPVSGIGEKRAESILEQVNS